MAVNDQAALAHPARSPRAPSGVNRGFLTGIARGAVLALAVQVLGAGLGYLLQVALARWLGAAQFGRYVYLIAWVTILALVAGLGFPLAVLRFIPEYRVKGDAARLHGLIAWSRGASLVTAVAVSLTAVALSFTLAPARISEQIALAAVLVPLGALINLDLAIIRAGGRVVGAYAPSLVIRPLLTIFGAGTGWLLAGGQLSTEGALTATLGAFAAVAAAQCLLVRRIDAEQRCSAVRAYEPRLWMRVATPLLLVAGFQVALSQTDLLVIGAVRGVRDAGLYSAAAKTATLVGYLLVAVNAVAAPMFAELEAKRDRAGLQRLATASAKWVFWPTLAITIGLAALAPVLLGLFGPSFVLARSALLILLVGQLVSAACGAVAYLLSMTGHQRDTAWVYGIVSVVNVPVCYLGARLFGLEGAAAATSLSLIVWNLWLHELTVRRIGVRASIVSVLMLDRRTRSKR